VLCCIVLYCIQCIRMLSLVPVQTVETLERCECLIRSIYLHMDKFIHDYSQTVMQRHLGSEAEG
jgi:hypothetical protein